MSGYRELFDKLYDAVSALEGNTPTDIVDMIPNIKAAVTDYDTSGGYGALVMEAVNQLENMARATVDNIHAVQALLTDVDNLREKFKG